MTVKLFGKNKKYIEAEGGAEAQRFAEAAKTAEAEGQLPLPELDILPAEENPVQTPAQSQISEPLDEQQDMLIKSLHQVLKAENLDDEGQEAAPVAARKMNLFPSHAAEEAGSAVSDEALEAAIRSVQDSAISSRRHTKAEAPAQPAWETIGMKLPAEAEQDAQPDSGNDTLPVSAPAEPEAALPESAESDAVLPEPEGADEAEEVFEEESFEEAAVEEAEALEAAIPETEAVGETEAFPEPEADFESEAAAAAEPVFEADLSAEAPEVPVEEAAPAAEEAADFVDEAVEEAPEASAVEAVEAIAEEPVLETAEAFPEEPEIETTEEAPAEAAAEPVSEPVEDAAEESPEEAAEEPAEEPENIAQAEAEDLSLSDKVEAALKETEAEAQPQDEESFLEELYALIGKPAQSPERAVLPEEGEPIDTRPEQIREDRPAGRITEEQIRAVQESIEDIPEDEEGSVPGWLKGALLLLISLLLSAMTFYAVASDVIGEIF